MKNNIQKEIQERREHAERLKKIALKLFEQLKSEKIDFFGRGTHRQYAVGIREIGAGQSDALIHAVRTEQFIVRQFNEFIQTGSVPMCQRAGRLCRIIQIKILRMLSTLKRNLQLIVGIS